MGGHTRSISHTPSCHLHYSAAGTYASAPGSAECQACDPGKAIATPGAIGCDLCSAGFATDAGATRCSPCPAGSASTASGSATCDECKPGEFSRVNGSIACSDCRTSTGYGNGYWSTPSSISCNICDQNFYDARRDEEAAADCRRCPKGAKCGLGTTVASLIAKRNYYRFTNTSDELYKCPLGKDSRKESLNASVGEDLCADGYTSALCCK